MRGRTVASCPAAAWADRARPKLAGPDHGDIVAAAAKDCEFGGFALGESTGASRIVDMSYRFTPAAERALAAAAACTGAGPDRESSRSAAARSFSLIRMPSIPRNHPLRVSSITRKGPCLSRNRHIPHPIDFRSISAVRSSVFQGGGQAARQSESPLLRVTSGDGGEAPQVLTYPNNAESMLPPSS